MKTLQSSKAVSRIATLTAVIAAGAVLVPSLASANTASNTTVRNTVYVDYADAGAVAQPQISDEVDVVVQLVAATPTLSVSAEGNQTISPSSTATYTYTVYSNANGPDSYNITTPLVESGGLSGSAATPSGTPITLGATTMAAAPGTITLNTPTVVSVPSDVAANLIVNGIAQNDVVVISGVRCDVTAVSDTGTALTGAITNSTITVDCDATITTPPVGTVIGEQTSFTVLVNPNGFTPPGPETVTVTATVTSVANGTLFDTDVTITTVEELLDVVKYVRNVTTGVAGIAPTVTVDSKTYYASGVVGVPTNTLEYLVEVTNTSAGNNATDTVISDTVPAFTTFSSTNFAVITNAGAVTTVTAAEDLDAGETVVAGPTTTIYLYPGSTVHGDDTASGGGNPNGDGGTVAAGLKAYGRFQVTID